MKQMKLKKKHYIFMVIMAVLIVVTIIGILLLKDGIKASEIPKTVDSSEQDDGDFQVVKEETICIENNQIAFTMDVATTHFEVLDKTTGKSYKSVAEVDSETGKSSIYLSEIAIDYYDKNSMKATMYSQDNSVEFGTYEVKKSDDAVQVYYEIRKIKDDFFVPAVFTQEVFENEILEKLEVGPKKRLQMYYKLRTAEGNKDLISEYPELANQNLYILTDSMSTNDYREVTDYFKDVGYTQKDYEEDTREMDVSEATIDLPAQFIVPVEYQVNEEGFTARVLSELIQSENDSYTLTNVRLLPSFGSITEDNEGYFLVPDGAGGLISFAKQGDANYNQQVYGLDAAIDMQQSLQLAEQVVLPVFGMNCVDSGYFAIIETAAECATVRGQVLGATNLSTSIYADFSIRAHDTTDIGAVSEVGSYNLYAKGTISEQPSVRYILLDEGHCDYSSMAACYQAYLVEQEILKERLKDKGTALYLDFTGYVTQESSLLGIPYNKKIILSRVENIESFIKELYAEDATNLSVRLKAYSHGGITNSLMDSFQVASDVGTTEEIQSLATSLKAHNGTLYLDHAADSVYENSMLDRFQKLTHATRRIDRMVVERGDYDIVIQDLEKDHNTYFSLSPKYYKSLVQNFVVSFEKQLGDKQEFGYSWANYGRKLTGDYNSSETIDRIQARKMADIAMSNTEGFGSILTDGGNVYAAKYANALLNIPLSNSSFQSVTESVPFYQMVMHGYKNYAGAPLNSVTDAETEWLKTIESGASMYYSCMTEDYTKIKDLDYRQKLYPISNELCCEDIISRYQAYASVFEKLSTQLIVKHEINEDGLCLTTYEDGTIIAVNYSSNDLLWGDITVEAKNFAVQ